MTAELICIAVDLINAADLHIKLSAMIRLCYKNMVDLWVSYEHKQALSDGWFTDTWLTYELTDDLWVNDWLTNTGYSWFIYWLADFQKFGRVVDWTRLSFLWLMYWSSGGWVIKLIANVWEVVTADLRKISINHP